MQVACISFDDDGKQQSASGISRKAIFRAPFFLCIPRAQLLGALHNRSRVQATALAHTPRQPASKREKETLGGEDVANKSVTRNSCTRAKRREVSREQMNIERAALVAGERAGCISPPQPANGLRQ
jgi:hypothetical protein